MTKKSDMSSIKNIGMGILDSLSGIKEEDSKELLGEKNNTVNAHKSVISKNVNIHKNKTIKELKSKRSFMLSENTIHKLGLLKLCTNDKNLSMIVEASINMYFDKNKGSIEELLSVYNKIK